jgi:hypothetical protein
MIETQIQTPRSLQSALACTNQQIPISPQPIKASPTDHTTATRPLVTFLRFKILFDSGTQNLTTQKEVRCFVCILLNFV